MVCALLGSAVRRRESVLMAVRVAHHAAQRGASRAGTARLARINEIKLRLLPGTACYAQFVL
jgi:hypothetical protein